MKRTFLLPALLLLLAAPTMVKAQAPTVLAEVFGNFDCANCKQADLDFDDFLFDKPKIVLINYHNDNPSPSDPFFYVARQGRNRLYRSDLYNFAADPTAVINGKVDVGSEPTWEDDCNRATQLPSLTVTAYKMADGLIYIHVKNTLTLPTAQRLNVALLESNIVKPNTLAQGVPPSGVWDNIFRMMLPAPDGFLFTPTGSDEFTYSFDPSLDDFNLDTWNPENMKAVAFLQDDQGALKKVQALGVVSLANLATGGVAVASSNSSASIKVLADPSKSSCQFWLTLPAAAHVRLSISDMLGREVRILTDQRLTEGQTSVEMNKGTLPAGCYIARMFVDGGEVDHAKLLIE